MSDFHQHGPITTLHRLTEGRAAAAEELLQGAAKRCDIRLVLPCHASDLTRAPLRHIAAELQGASWLRGITLVTNGGDFDPARIPLAATVLRSDGSAANAFASELIGRGLASPDAVRPAKGWNVWLGLGRALADGADVVAMHDADIASYRREMLVRLCLPAAVADFGYAFVKGYYRRVTEGVMFGRVTRLFFAPLVRACVRVGGHQPLLDFLGAFRYPLAGECALSAAAASDFPLVPGWGLETGLLCAAHAQLPPARVCQVELGPNYEHKHRPLDGTVGALAGMAAEVARTLLAGWRAEGVSLDAGGTAVLLQAYARTSAEAVERHAHDALLNGLSADAAGEAEAIRVFHRVLGEVLTESPTTPIRLPAWKHVFEKWPEARAAVQGLN